MQNLLQQFENRVMSNLKNIAPRISAIESRLDIIQAEQVRVSFDVDKLKHVVVQQQNDIENWRSRCVRTISYFPVFLRRLFSCERRNS